jgi:phosphohistidine swiveling domain-containing protein
VAVVDRAKETVVATMIKSFRELTSESQALAGGKGGTLAKLFQWGYPVPDGFVVLPSAFENDMLTPTARDQIIVYVEALRRQHADAYFAVRSSARSEDSASASFAGEFETRLNLKSNEEILDAIMTVFRSRDSERVKAYSSAQNLLHTHEIAVVVQLMVPAEIAGVLFTADPITGSYASMVGNFVYGLGEQLVSGEADAHSFRLLRPKGKYEGPNDFKRYASQLYKLAAKLENMLDAPQDLEWAVAQGKLYLLQARPITTLTVGNLETYEINESLREDALWVNTNVAEAVPDVFSPLTWSIVRSYDLETNYIPGYYVWSGNIYGRVYSNISRRVSVITIISGMSVRRVMGLLGDLFGPMPKGMTVPIHPATRFGTLREVLPRMMRVSGKMLKANRQLQAYLKGTPVWCREMTAHVDGIGSKTELLSLWKNELQPYSTQAWWSHVVAASRIVNVMRLERQLTKLVGTEDANTLLSNLGGETELASLGPLLGVARVAKGEITREQYLTQFGHRGPHEFELSIPHPAEDPAWLAEQIEEFQKSDVDADGLLAKQSILFEAAKDRFGMRYPRKAKWLEKQIANASKSAHLREAARSEFVRVFRVVRAFALKAGKLTGIGEEIFLLYIDEVLQLLADNDSAIKFISARKENYEKFKKLPPFPSVIRGRFNPLEWAKDPNRSLDYYDPTRSFEVATSATLKGYPGAAGRIEGTVRVLSNPEEGDALQSGEVLVARTTNVGWTPLFPKAIAIITDIGAPLSHAAIVARELGIPAVVGCGNATVRLKSGDRVIVDGGQGLVHIL